MVATVKKPGIIKFGSKNPRILYRGATNLKQIQANKPTYFLYEVQQTNKNNPGKKNSATAVVKSGYMQDGKTLYKFKTKGRLNLINMGDPLTIQFLQNIAAVQNNNIKKKIKSAFPIVNNKVQRYSNKNTNYAIVNFIADKLSVDGYYAPQLRNHGMKEGYFHQEIVIFKPKDKVIVTKEYKSVAPPPLLKKPAKVPKESSVFGYQIGNMYVNSPPSSSKKTARTLFNSPPSSGKKTARTLFNSPPSSGKKTARSRRTSGLPPTRLTFGL